MSSAKEIFKRNVIAVAKHKNISGGSTLSRLAEQFSNVGIEKTTCNSLLKETEEPKNLSLDKAEAVSLALGIPFYDMVNPYFSVAGSSKPFDMEVLKESMLTAKTISEREKVDNANFECELATYLYHAKVNAVAEPERYYQITKITRQYLG